MYSKSFDLPDRGLFFGLDFWGLLFTDSLSLCRETAGSSFSRVGEGKSAPSTASGVSKVSQINEYGTDQYVRGNQLPEIKTWLAKHNEIKF